MAAKVFLVTTGKDPVGDDCNSVIAGPNGPALLHDYRWTEKPTQQTCALYKFPTNVTPFRNPVYLLPVPLPVLSASREQLRFRAELRLLVYGAGMFVLGMFAHMAWLEALAVTG